MNATPNTDLKPHAEQSRWNRIAADRQFQYLISQKKKFIIPAFSFFLVYYLLLPILLGYAPRLMSTRVFGTVTLAYVYALSQFVVGWTIAWLYMRASSRLDRLVSDVLTNDIAEKDAHEKDLPRQQDSLPGGK